MLPSMLMPLIEDDGFVAETVRSFSDSMMKFAEDYLDGFINVGKGIGAIMLLFVAIYYIMSILDGGKFQLKMLFPLLIYLLVCNFTWVSKPVTYFTRTITATCTEAVGEGRKDLFNAYGCDGGSMIDLFWTIKNQGKTRSQTDTEEKAAKIATGNDNKNPRTGDDPDKKEEDVGWVEGMLYKVWENFKHRLLDQFSTNLTQATSNLNFAFSMVLAGIFSFICGAVAIACQAMGIVMTCIIVVFGPITWAFAVFPGRTGNIMSWFIRICQFSLYMPICALIDLFSLSLCGLMISEQSSFIALLAVLICDFVCITSVPTIASMIIEGAQGAVSLTGGLQAAGHLMGTAASIYTWTRGKFGGGGSKGGGGSQGGNGGNSSPQGSPQQSSGNQLQLGSGASGQASSAGIDEQ